MPTNQSCPLKNGWVLTATWSRPVAARDSRTAAAVASEAFLVNLTMSAPVTSARNSSAASSSSVLGLLNDTPRPMASRTADTTGSYAWPRVTARMPEPYSTNQLSSASRTRAPMPSTMTGAMPSGNWSAPLAKVWAPPGTNSWKAPLQRLGPLEGRLAHRHDLAFSAKCLVRAEGSARALDGVNVRDSGLQWVAVARPFHTIQGAWPAR